MIKKFLAAIAISVLLFVLPVPAESKVVKLDKDTVLLSMSLTDIDATDFRMIVTDFYDAGELAVQFLINTPGGGTDAMWNIMTQMDSMKTKGMVFTTVKLGEACSAGAFLWLNGDFRHSVEGARFMTHMASISSPFGLVPYEDLPLIWKLYIDKINNGLRQWLLDEVRDTEMVNLFLENGYGANNWFTTHRFDQLGLIHKILI